jgi:hypothetical protein
MNIAVALQTNDPTQPLTKEDLLCVPNDYLITVIRENCGFLFDIVGDRVYFIHKSVKDYLLKENEEVPGQMPSLVQEINLQDSHRTLAKVCMRYISLPFIKSSGFKSPDDYMGLNTIEQSKYHRWCKDSFEFGNYGFTNWIVHFNQGYEPDQVKSDLLEKASLEYKPELVKLAVDIFCCSAFPSHWKPENFKRLSRITQGTLRCSLH